MSKKKVLTNAVGAPADDDIESLSPVSGRGPLFLQDVYLQEKLAHFTRERIPERVVHAKGAGAFGELEMTHDVSRWTCAKFLQPGKKTEMLARFSTVGGEKGSADTARDPRGFALKFYTEDGNYDLVGNNIPIFFIRDPLKFPDFVHTQKRDPQTNLKDADMFWDFLSLTPESLHQATFLFTDRGTPRDYRHMSGFSSHTYMWYNRSKEHVWVKYHFIPQLGNATWTAAEADELAGTNPDYATEDLFNAIERGEYPQWTFYVQVMTPAEAETYHFNPFDVTKVWYHADFPLIEVGKLTLTKNPKNFFTEIEQAAFAPAHFVPGIAVSPDKLLQGRLFAYGDAQRYRLGVNHEQLPPNRAHAAEVYTYQRDGVAQIDGVGASDGKNYFPNSFDEASVASETAPPALEVAGIIERHEMPLENADFEQVHAFWDRVLDEPAKTNTVSNIVGHLGNAATRIQYRQTALFYRAHSDYGTRVAAGLGLELNRVKELAVMTQAERVAATQA